MLLLFLLILQSCSENSRKDKVVKEYYPNGKVRKEYYINSKNQKNGLYREYYENGRVKYFYFYVSNLLNGEQREYYDNGNLRALAYYKKSKPDSIVKWYYPNGVLQSESFRLEGQLFGGQKEYSSDGRLKDMYFMKNDSDQLFSFDFNDEGKIISHSKNFSYCIYEKDTLSTLDTAKLVFYTIVPPNYHDEIKIIERKRNGYYRSNPAMLDNINNNKGILIMRRITEPGEYEIGFVIKLKNTSFGSSIADSLFIPIKVRNNAIK